MLQFQVQWNGLTKASIEDPGTICGTGASNDDFSSDTNVKMTFSNKTDSGLDNRYGFRLWKLLATTPPVALRLTSSTCIIKGGFGEIQLGMNDGAGDQFTRTASDLSGPDANSDNGGTSIWVQQVMLAGVARL